VEGPAYLQEWICLWGQELPLPTPLHICVPPEGVGCSFFTLTPWSQQEAANRFSSLWERCLAFSGIILGGPGSAPGQLPATCHHLIPLAQGKKQVKRF
jgi:hypothetical protein